jgi:integrase
MQRSATEQTGRSGSKGRDASNFTKVRDGRKQPIRGLWLRNGKYYAQISVEDATTGLKKVCRVPLLNKERQPVETMPQAVEALRRLKTHREDGTLPVLTRTPKFCNYVKHYLEFIKAGQGMKKPGTIENEEYVLDKWIAHLGERHLDRIREVDINTHSTKRLNAGVHPRTVNLDVVVLRNVLNLARKEKWIKVLPETEWLKCESKKRDLFTPLDLENLCAAALDTKDDGEPVTKNGQQLCDFLRLLAYCGAREQEGIALRWKDVDSERGQLTIGADGDTKNRSSRVVDFNSKLKAHLQDMQKRRAPDSEWLFPSPQRGQKDVHAKTLRVSLELVRAHAAIKQQEAGEKPTLATKAFHDLRHHFISYCVMSGIDFMTIAAWVGHRDGGILIGKVYGHLADSHKKEQALKLNFGPMLAVAV